jgi:hypothetical protein
MFGLVGGLRAVSAVGSPPIWRGSGESLLVDRGEAGELAHETPDLMGSPGRPDVAGSSRERQGMPAGADRVLCIAGVGCRQRPGGTGSAGPDQNLHDPQQHGDEHGPIGSGRFAQVFGITNS